MKTLFDKPRKAARVNKKLWSENVTLRQLVKALRRENKNLKRTLHVRGI